MPIEKQSQERAAQVWFHTWNGLTMMMDDEGNKRKLEGF
jgi:hypothetical protein